MEKFSFFNDVNDDRVYYAEDWARHLKKYFTNGIFNNELNVLANNDMTITIKEGDANIEGYRYTNTGDLVKTIEMADGTLNRIDNVVLRLDLTNRLISAQIIKGTFADKPVAPELVRTSTIYDLRIAKISIPAGTTTITQDLITNTRFITSDCGNVISTVQTPDTENLFIQMQTLFEKQINELNNNFETWFDSMKNQLSSDAAGNLQNQINDLNSNKADNATYDLDSNNLQLLANGKNVGDSVHIPTGITDEVSGEENLKIINNKGVVKFSLDGKTEQKSYTGKNLLNYIDNLQSISGLTNTINSDGSITTTGKPTANFTRIVKDYDITNLLEDGQKYTISQTDTSLKTMLQITAYKNDGTITYYSSRNGANVLTINKSIYTKFLACVQTTSMSLWGDESLTINNKYMLCKDTDTADTSFEPYVGGQPSPNPDYPQEIENVRGVENLLKLPDGTYESNGIKAVIKDGVITLNGTATATDFLKIPIGNLKSGTYSMSANNDQTVGSINGSGQFASYRINNNTDNKTIQECILGKKNATAKFTILDDPKIAFIIRTNVGLTYNNFVIKPQLEEGPIAHNFVPNGSNYLQLKNTTDNESKIINIDLKGNNLCSNKEQTLKDELVIENGRAKIIKKYDEYVFTGNETFSFTDNGARIMSNTGRISQLKNVYISIPQSSLNITPSFCTHYTVDGQGNVVKGSNKFGFSQYDNAKFIYFPADYSTIEEFKAKLKALYDAGTPVIVQYPLSEPQIIDLGEVDFDLIEGNSTLNLEEDLKSNMSIKYYTDSTVVDLKKKVENKQNVILHGTTVPSNGLGEDGDIYLQHN